MRRYKRIKVSQERLNDTINEELDKLKVNERMQAEFFNELCKEVKKSDNEVLFPVKPNVRKQNTDSWIIAMQIVIEYLKNYKMDLSLETINDENKDEIKPLFFTHGKLGISIDEKTIPLLLESTEDIRKKTIRERIKSSSMSNAGSVYSISEE